MCFLQNFMYNLDVTCDSSGTRTLSDIIHSPVPGLSVTRHVLLGRCPHWIILTKVSDIQSSDEVNYHVELL